MAKKKKTPNRRAEVEDDDRAPKQKPVSFSPFKDLKRLLAERTAQAPKPPIAKTIPTISREPKIVRTKAEAVVVEDEVAILREAYAGVRPFGSATAQRMPITPEVHHTIVSEEAEVLAALSDLVSGLGNFDLTETEEYVEGTRVGLDPRLSSRLRHGEFAVQDHTDLHGMIQPAAKEALREFILKSVRKGLRTVLVVHGRGLGSPGGRPVLKHAAAQWLSHGEIGAHVLAFTTSRPQDGGAGAMYVLLRRDRRRAPFDVLHGAKRRE
jgi:DNA-nicking Smr family endonuclease